MIDTHRRRGARRGDRGAAAVELAILLPLLLLVVFAVIDYGRMLNAQITLTEAARESARAEALGGDPDARFQDATTALEDDKKSLTWDERCVDGDNARATANYQFEFITPLGGIAAMFGGNTIGDDVILTGKGVMPCMS